MRIQQGDIKKVLNKYDPNRIKLSSGANVSEKEKVRLLIQFNENLVKRYNGVNRILFIQAQERVEIYKQLLITIGDY